MCINDGLSCVFGRIIQNMLRRPQVGRCKSLGKSSIDGSQKLTAIVKTTCATPQPGKARCGAQLPRKNILLARAFQRLQEVRLRSLRGLRGAVAEKNLTLNT